MAPVLYRLVGNSSLPKHSTTESNSNHIIFRKKESIQCPTSIRTPETPSKVKYMKKSQEMMALVTFRFYDFKYDLQSNYLFIVS